jgi:two-component system response regulator GlrR
MQTNARILVVDDEPLLLRMVRRMLRPIASEVLTADSVDAALAVLETQTVELVLTDLNLGARSGADLLAEVRLRWPTLPVVVITNHGTIDLAVGLMRQGATDFVRKPLEPEVLLPRIEHALTRAALEGEVVDLRARLGAAGRPSRQLIGEAPVFRALLDRLALVARVDETVLLRGETGTGKELMARALHDLSGRRTQPFVAVNCGALPEALLESELFGHVAGAFTDAKREKRGLVAEADGGTLFLDEIGDVPLALQVKLLRFLQEGEIRPVGGARSVPVDVRIVAATHCDLEAAIEAGQFREDLFYRLNVVPLSVPPLRARAEDVPLLAAHALARMGRRLNRSDLRLHGAAQAKLMAHGWPGNVRELENVVRRAAIFAPGVQIMADDIELDMQRKGVADAAVRPDLSVPLREAKAALISEFERAYVQAALQASGGNVSRAARQAGKERKSFHDLITRYDIEVHRGS